MEAAVSTRKRVPVSDEEEDPTPVEEQRKNWENTNYKGFDEFNKTKAILEENELKA